MKTDLESHPIVSREEWLSARRELLEKEKEQTHRQDSLAAARRELPWVKVEKDYCFETTEGRKSLSELFDGRSQLFIYHFMFGAGWEEGCPGCSFLVDHLDGANLHLSHHDVTVAVVSRAPLAELLPYKKRMDWKFDWVSSAGSDFNFDFQVSATPEELEKGVATYNFEEGEASEENPGMSVFFTNSAGEIFHTYSGYGRAGDILIGAHNFLDFTPRGRNEKSTMDWVRRHDSYTTR